MKIQLKEMFRSKYPLDLHEFHYSLYLCVKILLKSSYQLLFRKNNYH